MNPFDLRGPEFLIFYTAFAAVVLYALWYLRQISERGEPPQLDLADPYLIAYMRGDINEALRVASVSLIDRKVMIVDDKIISTAKNLEVESLHHELEKRVALHFKSGRTASSMMGDTAFIAIGQKYNDKLVMLGLLPGAGDKAVRNLRTGIGVLILVLISGIKFMVAISRGHSNILFLIFLTFIAVKLAMYFGQPRLSARGQALLHDLRNLFGDLKARRNSLRAGGATKEVVWLAAVFGLALLPTDVFGYARKLYPRASVGTSNFGIEITCGSSSSSSSSGGGGCSGGCSGGCGGGCGGCGS